MNNVVRFLQSDEGEFGSCSGTAFLFTARYPALLLYMVSGGLLVYLLTGKMDVASVNGISDAAVLCFLGARTLRGSLHFLWRERGRLTFSRITEITMDRISPALGNRSAVNVILADSVFFPLLIAFSAFHNAGPFSRITNILFQGNTTGLWIGGGLSVISLLLSLIHWVVLLPMDRTDPYRFEGRKNLIPSIIVPLSTWLGLPMLAIVTSSIPCKGKVMRLIMHESCASSLHRWCMGFASLMLLFYSLLQDVALNSLARTGNARSDERLCDGLMLQLMLLHRLTYVLIASLATRPIWYLIAFFISAWILIKIIKSPFAASRVMNDLTKASLLLCLVSSFCCSLLLLFNPGFISWIWLSLWVFTSGFILVAFMYKYKFQIYENVDDVYYFDI